MTSSMLLNSMDYNSQTQITYVAGWISYDTSEKQTSKTQH